MFGALINKTKRKYISDLTLYFGEYITHIASYFGTKPLLRIMRCIILNYLSAQLCGYVCVGDNLVNGGSRWVNRVSSYPLPSGAFLLQTFVMNLRINRNRSTDRHFKCLAKYIKYDVTDKIH